jgi:phosphatidylglycerophosphate synthase
VTVSVRGESVRAGSGGGPARPVNRPILGRSGSSADSPIVGWSGQPIHPPTAGLLSQLAVLALLAAGVGLGTAGWMAGITYAVVTWVLLSLALNQPGVRGWGPADTVTLARATLVGGVTALVADSLVGPVPVAALVSLAAVALALDAVDGQVARRTGTTSRLGAQFDMETDSVLVLALSIFVAISLGWWVLAIGAYRYAFGVAGRLLPWLRAPLPPAIWRKTVAALQGIVLVVASAGVLPGWAATGMVGLALAVLSGSFGRDVGYLWRRRQQPAVHVTGVGVVGERPQVGGHLRAADPPAEDQRPALGQRQVEAVPAE